MTPNIPAVEPIDPEACAGAIDESRVLKTVCGDRELLAEIAGLFLEDMPSVMERLKAALEERDGERIWRSAHAVKGSVSNFSADGAEALAAKLEDAARAEDFAVAEQTAGELAREVERVSADLRRYV